MAKYIIAQGTAITSKGIVLGEGAEVTSDNFPSEEIFNSLVKAKKIISSEEKTEEKSEKKSDDKKSDDKKSDEKKVEDKKAEEKK